MSLATVCRRGKSCGCLFTTMIWKCRIVDAGPRPLAFVVAVVQLLDRDQSGMGSGMDDILCDAPIDGVCRLTLNRPDALNRPGRSRWLIERLT